jgi:hypothetical protein
VCVCPCACLSALVCASMCVSMSVRARVCLFVCLCVSVYLCLSVCVCVSVCYNNGKFLEILRSAHPSGSKKELRVTSFATYGFNVIHIFVTCLHSICTPENIRFLR